MISTTHPKWRFARSAKKPLLVEQSAKRAVETYSRDDLVQISTTHFVLCSISGGGSETSSHIDLDDGCYRNLCSISGWRDQRMGRLDQ
jgi:hypothetical protein